MSEAIKQYISTKYDQHPDMFRRDLQQIDKMRADAVNSLEAHASGIRNLTSYAAQLVWIGGKFPIDIGVDFTWYPALGYNTQRPVSQNNLRFELANVLYNLASLYSQLAVSQNRSTSEGLKAACNYFCQAAGVISHLKSEIIPELRTVPPEDMDTMTLESLQQLLLAQAQECFWSKAVKDGLKDGLIAKLAAKVSDFYDQAAEYGTKSDTVSTDWIHHMTAKHHHFAAAAQYRASRECLEKQNYGEEVARLRDSLVCVNEALKEARWINKAVLADLNGLKLRVSEDLKRAEKDNDIIYLIPVPPKSELKVLGRAGMATPRIPPEVADPIKFFGDRGTFGQPLFAKLVPYAVHIAVQIYGDRRDRLVNTKIIDELESLTSQLRDLLKSLNLPGSLQALEKPLGLPLTLTSHADEIRQQDGLHRLRMSIHEISKLRANDAALYEEGVELLKSEAAEDERAKLKYGTDRWTRQPSHLAAEKLYAQVAEIDGYLKSAQSSDDLVKGKFKECESVLQVLSGTNRELEEYVPSTRRAVTPPHLERVAANLRSILHEVSRMESRRKRSIQELRDKAKADDINSTILVETARLEREFPMQKIEPAQFENLFEERLQRYDGDLKALSEEQEEQRRISNQLVEANAAFVKARQGDTSTKQREQALQRLEVGYLKYKEVVSNLDAARQFYNDLATLVSRFRDECQKFAYQRRMEAGQLEAYVPVAHILLSFENLSPVASVHNTDDPRASGAISDLSTALSSLSLHNTAQLQDRRERESLRSHYQPPAPADEPLTAPTPTRPVVAPHPPVSGIWSPEMGIKFESGPAAEGLGGAGAGRVGGNAPAAQGLSGNDSRNLKYPDAGQGTRGPLDMSRGVRFG